MIAMLIVRAVALIPATLAAWLAARRALRPLSQIAHRATRVTGGDLSVRMGPVATPPRSQRWRSPLTPCWTGCRQLSTRSAGSCTTLHTSCGRL